VATDDRLHLALARDPPGSIDALLARLSVAERAEAHGRSGTARRHFVLGRLAAHAAIRRTLGAGTGGAVVEVLAGPAGEPRARVDGPARAVSASISHVGRMAVACAWRSAPGYAAGVDLERVRPTRVAQSGYAFSARERALLCGVPQGPVLAGLAGWALKEAVWKALWPHQPPNPAAVGIRTLSLASGRATVDVARRYLRGGDDAAIRARLEMVTGPDGDYVLAVAEIASSPSEGRAGEGAIHHSDLTGLLAGYRWTRDLPEPITAG
jgi:4'-phosphopantetheinyl transferase EntD